jgi:D-psicose/D-tagatose/L-ribulose 3-epimerase
VAFVRVSLCNEVIAGLPFEQQCAFARTVGYDGLEIAPMTLSDEPHRLTAARRAELRRMAADAGIAITGLHYVLRAPAGLSITSADAGVLARTVEVMRALCDLAVDLGAGYLVHGSPQQRELAPGDETEGRKRGVACLAAVAEAAEPAGVTYCIEPLSPDQTAFVNTVAEAATIVLEINSAAIRTMVDCSAAARGGEIEPVPELMRKWLPTGLIAHVHLNDPNRRGPGEGDLRFEPILSALRDGGYTGMAAIEPFDYQPDGPTCAARSIGYIRGLLEALER